mmetsp:Transcript_54931/g.116729  ORF Transcript_54931/g.116729 Transcript_54931/m.116729 type:complete len:123 (+) Transcript_54931:331-699(+)
MSARLAVLSRCAIISVVLPLQTAAAVFEVSMFRWISLSVPESRALVASSSRMSFGRLMMHRARPTRCLSPPESFIPRSPTKVSRPSGREVTSGSSAEVRTASQTSSSVASSLPYMILSRSDA